MKRGAINFQPILNIGLINTQPQTLHLPSRGSQGCGRIVHGEEWCPGDVAHGGMLLGRAQGMMHQWDGARKLWCMMGMGDAREYGAWRGVHGCVLRIGLLSKATGKLSDFAIFLGLFSPHPEQLPMMQCRMQRVLLCNY